MEENIKLKNASKGKDRRQPYSQDGMPKRSTKPGLIKSSTSHPAPPQPHDNGSPVKKILNDVKKIVKIGIEKDYALLQSDNTLQTSNEMVDNLRKNILHLQMEYEKLDQNYQREISHRSEIIKRMDVTQETIESIMKCSNTLSNSLKQLEADKFKIAEFYQLIHQNQKEVETKHLKVEKFMKEQDEILKTKMVDIKKSHDSIVFQHSETISQLNRKLNCASDKLKAVMEENEKLQKRVQEFQESSSKLEMCLDQQQRLNSWHKENTNHLKCTLKKVKLERFKYQKLWKRKKIQIFTFLKKHKTLKINLKKAESLYNQCVSANKTLESKNYEWEEKFKKYLEQDHASFQNWEAEKFELNDKVFQKEAQIETLNTEIQNLSEKFMELMKNDKSKQVELENVQNEFSKVLSENLKLKDENLNLIQENSNKNKIISDLQGKLNSSDADFTSQVDFHKRESLKLQELANKLEIQLSEMHKRLAVEKKEKENLISDIERKYEEHAKVFEDKIGNLEKLLEEKSVFIRNLEAERNHAAVENHKSIENFKEQLQREKQKNNELSKNLQCHDDIKKQLEKSEKQSSDFSEKLAEVNALNKALNRKQNDLETDIENLKNDINLEKKSYEALKGEYKKAENELANMQKMAEENLALKSSVADLKNLLEATEARVEAYKVVVKKLETEKIEAKNAHSEEASRLRSELASLSLPEEPARTARDSSRHQMETPKKNFDQTNKRVAEEPPAAVSQKENELETEKWRQTSTPPLQSGKKFLSTPRKIYTSTPQPGFRNLTPAQKKKDPYEFDSDSSVEQLDQDKVLKVFNRQKRETKREANKRSKTNK